VTSRRELAEAYARTIYRVAIDDARFELRVGAGAPPFAAWLAAQGASRWAWLTSVNPRSRQLDAAENRRRLAALAERLERAGARFWRGVAVDPDGGWPDEPSFLVLDLSAERVAALAREFAQHAFLAGAEDGRAELVWVAGEPEG
jgi:hypothetical protein